jgi:hypothetical protein
VRKEMRVQLLPTFVRKVLSITDVWIVGSMAHPDASLSEGSDFDLLVPYSDWDVVARLIPNDAKVNSQGGWRFMSSGISIDVWPGDLGKFVTGLGFEYAWHPRSGKRIKRFGEC